MADSEQVEELRSGVEVWNHWRRSHRDVRIDLGVADLRGVDLRGANLSDATFYRAGLVRADLSSADLREADLTSTNLWGANFSGADLSGANLAFAELGETLFINANLSRAIGLDFCSHYGPSTLDSRTISKSGMLPLVFLRGCGLPDEYVKPALFRASGFSSCFISHSTKDKDFVDQLYADLQDHGVRCWFAPHDIRGGKKLHDQIDEAIGEYDRLLLILSEHIMKSEWVKSEIAKARAREVRESRQVLFPISLVLFDEILRWSAFDGDIGKDAAREIREYFIPDFTEWKQDSKYRTAFERLLHDLRANTR